MDAAALDRVYEVFQDFHDYGKRYRSALFARREKREDEKHACDHNTQFHDDEPYTWPH